MSFKTIADRLRQHLNAQDAVVRIAPDGTIEIAAPSNDSDRFLEVRVLDQANIEVAFVVPTRRGSPFEQIFTAPPEQTDEIGREVVEFVCDVVASRVVLGWDARPFHGGRRFIKMSQLTSSSLRDLAWIVSWRGTRDWESPNV